MKKNIGTPDKFIRILIAALITFFFYDGTISGILGIVLLVFAGIIVLTSFISFCPLYNLIGVSTCPFKNEKPW